MKNKIKLRIPDVIKKFYHRIPKAIIAGLLILIIIGCVVIIIKPSFSSSFSAPTVSARISGSKLSNNWDRPVFGVDLMLSNQSSKDLWFMDTDFKLTDTLGAKYKPVEWIRYYDYGQRVLGAGKTITVYYEFLLTEGRIPEYLTFTNDNFPENFTFMITNLDTSCCRQEVTPSVIQEEAKTQLEKEEKESLIQALNDFLAGKNSKVFDSKMAQVSVKLPEVYQVSDYSTFIPEQKEGVEFYFAEKPCYKFADDKGTLGTEAVYCKVENFSYTFYSKEKLKSFNQGFSIYYNSYPNPAHNYASKEIENKYYEELVNIGGREILLRKYEYSYLANETPYTTYNYVLPLATGNTVTVSFNFLNQRGYESVGRELAWNVFQYILPTIKAK